MDRQFLKQIIIDQQAYKLPTPWVERGIDLSSIQNGNLVGVIVGLRRCGKSTLLQYIRQNSPESAYYLNFDDDRLADFKLDDFQTLLELLIELYGEQHTFFFDEIQNIPEWERFVRRLHDTGNKVYITGSNATLFSQELGTRLTGRYTQVILYPFSFSEYLSFFDLTLNPKQLTSVQKALVKKSFNDYVEFGGIPEYLRYKNKDHLHFLYESILYRDIVARYNLSNPKVIKELTYCLASNNSKEVTFNSLRKQLGVPSPSTISDYCGYLEDSFLCFFMKRFNYALKKQTHYAKKVYFIDQMLAKTIGFHFSEDTGRTLENIVFLELKRQGNEVYFHQDKKECDFVVWQQNQIVSAIQVCTRISDLKTKDREISGLLEALVAYDLKEGLILTENAEGKELVTVNNEVKTIHIRPVWHWLLDRV